MLSALAERRFFKLIGGGCLTEADTVARLSAVYAAAGADCIDIAPEPAVLSAVKALLDILPAKTPRPALMVSIPLDPDPHFRKIDLAEPDCILCGACVPICPTEAIEISPAGLDISQPLCYGCNRCVTVCPTEALSLAPFLMKETLTPVLASPAVDAVEIHTRYADPCMANGFLADYEPLLRDKVIALCFRPDQVDPDQWLNFTQVFLDRFEAVLLQVDGQPMSGSDKPEASLAAISAARLAKQHLDAAGMNVPITISGGINTHTAAYLREPPNRFIAGVGMGTIARRHVWHYLNPSDVRAGIDSARSLVGSFQALSPLLSKTTLKSAIIRAEA